jgi:CRP-like cAMP-binding protein
LRRRGEGIMTYRMSEEYKLPQEKRMVILGAGSVVGESDLVKKDHYTATLKCLSKTGAVLELRKEYFRQYSCSITLWL